MAPIRSETLLSIGRWIDNGWAFVSVDYSSMSYGFTYSDILSDVKTAFQFTRANAPMLGIQNSSFIFVGEQAGGSLAAITAFSLQNRAIRGVVNLYGPLDPVHHWLKMRDTAPEAIAQWKKLLSGSYQGKKRAWQNASTTYWTSMASSTDYLPPLLSFQGEEDVRVLPEITEYVHRKLSSKGVENLLILLPYHGTELIDGYYSLGHQLFRYVTERFTIAQEFPHPTPAPTPVPTSIPTMTLVPSKAPTDAPSHPPTASPTYSLQPTLSPTTP